MKFIKELTIMNEKDDLSKLPEDVVKKLKKLIRDGATDLNIQFDNTLALVKKAFSLEGIEFPTPSERSAFMQFEELLKYAVKEMSEARKGTDNSWRMSSTVFREMKESFQRVVKIRVCELGDKFGKSHTVEAKNMETVVDMIRKQAGKKAFDMNVEYDADKASCLCSFAYQGIQREYKIKLYMI